MVGFEFGILERLQKGIQPTNSQELHCNWYNNNNNSRYRKDIIIFIYIHCMILIRCIYNILLIFVCNLIYNR